jgi:uncharacterized membrane protein/1-acyl-sn-glycerol-3-phosphate acyltransferase
MICVGGMFCVIVDYETLHEHRQVNHISRYSHPMRVIKILFVCHLAALAFGLGSLLFVPLHSEPGETNPIGGNLFQLVLLCAGSLQILFGAATLLLFGLLFLGPGKTLIFFVTSLILSMCIELLGNSTGFPFGISAAPTFPVFQVSGLVPYSAPFSWFYMGLTCALLASKLTSNLQPHRQALWSLILGISFLTTWAMALGLAMASEPLSFQFWLWHAHRSPFGTAGANLVGWTLNSLLIVSLSRLLWRPYLDTRHLANWLPFGVYVANTGFVLALDLGGGLWGPLCLSALLVLLPVSLALSPREATHPFLADPGRAALSQLIWLVMRAGSRIIGRRLPDLHIEGLEHLPHSGPVLIAARHYHYFYDGYLLLRAIPRRLHVIVALDWLQTRRWRFVIEQACALADWPIVLRSEQIREHATGRQWAYAPIETRRYLRQVALDAVRLLRSGVVLVIFPEGYPNIDPHPTPKADFKAFLPFRPGFVKLAELTERDGQTRVAIIPVGLAYTRVRGRRWYATVRFGPALFRDDFASADQVRHAVEEWVHVLSSQTLEETLPS